MMEMLNRSSSISFHQNTGYAQAMSGTGQSKLLGLRAGRKDGSRNFEDGVKVVDDFSAAESTNRAFGRPIGQSPPGHPGADWSATSYSIQQRILDKKIRVVAKKPNAKMRTWALLNDPQTRAMAGSHRNSSTRVQELTSQRELDS